MKKIKYVIWSLLLFPISVTRVHADCTKEEIAKFKETASEYKVTYEFNKETKDYTIFLHQPEEPQYTFYLDDEMNIETVEDISPTKRSFSGIKPGKYELTLSGKDEICIDMRKTIELKLPKYNTYSEDPLCDGIEEFVLCRPTYDKEIDYDTFVSRVNTYKKNHTNENKEPQNIEQPNLFIEYIKENLVQIIIILSFIILLTITLIVTIKTVRKSRRLE